MHAATEEMTRGKVFLFCIEARQQIAAELWRTDPVLRHANSLRRTCGALCNAEAKESRIGTVDRLLLEMLATRRASKVLFAALCR
jgi:hypothetical protein